MSQSINNEEAEEPFDMHNVQEFIKSRETKNEDNFSFKKEDQHSDNENVFEGVLGGTLHEKKDGQDINYTYEEVRITERCRDVLDNTNEKYQIITEDFNYTE